MEATQVSDCELLSIIQQSSGTPDSISSSSVTEESLICCESENRSTAYKIFMLTLCKVIIFFIIIIFKWNKTRKDNL